MLIHSEYAVCISYLSVTSMMLLLSVFVGVEGEITPKDYTMSDGTRVTFGNMTTIISDSELNRVFDIQVDRHISGNFLLGGFSSIITVNGSNFTTIVGTSSTGYVNGYGTNAKLSYPVLLQITSEIVLVSELYNNCIRILNRTNNNWITDFVGSCIYFGNVDGVGTDARFYRPSRMIQHLHNPNLVFISQRSDDIRLLNVTSQSVTTYLSYNFGDLLSLAWDTYYCNVMLIADRYSFMRLELDTFTLTSYGTSSGFTDGSLHAGQYRYIYDISVIYKDLYLVVDSSNYRVRVIDTASCVVSSICTGAANSADGSLDQCDIDYPLSTLFTSGVLYIGGDGYFRALPINIDSSGSSGSTTTQSPSCTTISTEGTKNESSFTDEASCQQPNSTTNSTTTPTTPTAYTVTTPAAVTSTPSTATTTTITTPATATTTPTTTTVTTPATTTTTPTTTTVNTPATATTTPTTTTITTPATATTTPTATTVTTPATTTTTPTETTVTTPATTTTTPTATTVTTPATTTTTPTATTVTTPATTTTTPTATTVTTPATTTTTPTATTVTTPATTVTTPATTTNTPTTTTVTTPATTTTTPTATTVTTPATTTTTSTAATTTTPATDTTITTTPATTTTTMTGSSSGTPQTTGDVATTTGYTCAYGRPDDIERKTCVEGCFGLYKDGQSMVGCMADLDLTNNGFADTSTCGTKEQDGYCNKVPTADGEVENCVRCCTSKDSCNSDYKDKCDYVPTEEGCSSCALRVSDVVVLLIAMVISLYTP